MCEVCGGGGWGGGGGGRGVGGRWIEAYLKLSTNQYLHVYTPHTLDFAVDGFSKINSFIN